MKTFLVPLLAVSVLMLVGCASPVVRRIESNPEIYNALSDRHKQRVQTGQVEEGMSKEAVFLAWGHPDRASKGTRKGQAYERWSYRGYEAVHGTNYGFGVGTGYHHDPFYYYQPSLLYVPFEAGWVEFLNNRVSAWSVAH